MFTLGDELRIVTGELGVLTLELGDLGIQSLNLQTEV